jgi:hypothetical protein
MFNHKVGVRTLICVFFINELGHFQWILIDPLYERILTDNRKLTETIKYSRSEEDMVKDARALAALTLSPKKVERKTFQTILNECESEVVKEVLSDVDGNTPTTYLDDKGILLSPDSKLKIIATTPKPSGRYIDFYFVVTLLDGTVLIYGFKGDCSVQDNVGVGLVGERYSKTNRPKVGDKCFMVSVPDEFAPFSDQVVVKSVNSVDQTAQILLGKNIITVPWTDLYKCIEQGTNTQILNKDGSFCLRNIQNIKMFFSVWESSISITDSMGRAMSVLNIIAVVENRDGTSYYLGDMSNVLTKVHRQSYAHVGSIMFLHGTKTDSIRICFVEEDVNNGPLERVPLGFTPASMSYPMTENKEFFQCYEAAREEALGLANEDFRNAVLQKFKGKVRGAEDVDRGIYVIPMAGNKFYAALNSDEESKVTLGPDDVVGPKWGPMVEYIHHKKVKTLVHRNTSKLDKIVEVF